MEPGRLKLVRGSGTPFYVRTYRFQTRTEIRIRTGMETIREQLARRRWTWLGHVLRMFYHSHSRIAFTWVPEGKRKGSRPRETWRRTVERELKDSGLRTLVEAASAADDRRYECGNDWENSSVFCVYLWPDSSDSVLILIAMICRISSHS